MFVKTHGWDVDGDTTRVPTSPPVLPYPEWESVYNLLSGHTVTTRISSPGTPCTPTGIGPFSLRRRGLPCALDPRLRPHPQWTHCPLPLLRSTSPTVHDSGTPSSPIGCVGMCGGVRYGWCRVGDVGGGSSVCSVGRKGFRPPVSGQVHVERSLGPRHEIGPGRTFPPPPGSSRWVGKGGGASGRLWGSRRVRP